MKLFQLAAWSVVLLIDPGARDSIGSGGCNFRGNNCTIVAERK